MIIGTDFDNTLVSYDALMHRVALELELFSNEALKSKRDIRDHLRRLPDGEIAWQKIQGMVYGPRMQEATLIDGVSDFFHRCRAHGISPHIVSHKTEFANYDESRTPLRKAALAWMARHRFFKDDGMGLSRAAVYFESTRKAKIARIAALGCTHFIDDLEETFLDPTFPGHINKILYTSTAPKKLPPNVLVISNWEEIGDHVFA